MATAALQLETAFVRDAAGRVVATREPSPSAGPLFVLVRDRGGCAWAARTDVPDELAGELARLAVAEPPLAELERDAPPVHAARYAALLAAWRPQVHAGPAFEFPDAIAAGTDGVVTLADERPLARHFRGWIDGEIAAGRAPAAAVLDDDGAAISVCFCARASAVAAEAGVETAAARRGRGLAVRVTAAWAAAVRASGRTPLYSTDWTNAASLTVARKLGLRAYAASYSIVSERSNSSGFDEA